MLPLARRDPVLEDIDFLTRREQEERLRATQTSNTTKQIAHLALARSFARRIGMILRLPIGRDS